MENLYFTSLRFAPDWDLCLVFSLLFLPLRILPAAAWQHCWLRLLDSYCTQEPPLSVAAACEGLDVSLVQE